MSHEGGSVWTRMHPVACPMVWRSVLDGFVEHRLKGHEHGLMDLGHFFCRCPVLVELGKPFVVDRSAFEDKGFANDQLGFGQGAFRSYKKGVEIVLVGLDRSVVPAI